MLKKYITPQNFLMLGCCLLAIGIPCDGFLRFFENLGVISLVFAAILNFKNFNLSKLMQPIPILLGALFALCAFGYLYVSNLNALSSKLQLKILYVLIPLAFSNLPPITQNVKRLSIFLFTIVTATIALLTCIDYALHFNAYNEMVQQSKPILIIGGTMHIYFSVMLALSVFLGLHLLNQNFKIIIHTTSDKILLVAIVINFIALHILSARTGLMAFYIVLIALLFSYSLRSRKYKTFFGGIFIIALFPTIMYLAVPSVKNRINNTYDDLHRYISGDYVGYFSISGRFETWKVAYHIFQEHKIFGVGCGDLQDEVESQFLIDGSRLMREERLPNCHNQYIETLATHGLIGMVLFAMLLFYMFQMVKEMPKNNYIMLCFITLFFASFLVESLLEREAGITLFLFFFFLIKNNAYDTEKYTSVAP